MKFTKIEWCDATWNPVTGCRHGCEYCYAKRFAVRFGNGAYDDGENHVYDGEAIIRDGNRTPGNSYMPWGFSPTFRPYKLEEPQHWRKPRTVFVCSMADLFGEWVPDEWIHSVMDACCAAPQHRYLFLTKNPERYGDVIGYLETGVNEIPEIWFGATAATNAQLARAYESNATWISMEPICEDMNTDEFFTSFYHDGISETERGRWSWVVLGAETGNRKGKVVPKKEWIDAICAAADRMQTSVFMKDSLVPIVGEANMRRELPWRG